MKHYQITVYSFLQYFNAFVWDIQISFFLEIEAEFTVPLKETEIIEGASVTLVCEVSREDAEVTWFKDDIQIAPDESHAIIAEGTFRRLSISKAKVDDEAEYTVKMGEKTTKAMLWVEGVCLHLLSMILANLFRFQPA